MLIPPVGANNVGSATGGGLLDMFTGGAKQDDGSVGLFDGVMMKAGLGGMVGAALGFVLPFGGPMIGGIIGSIAGAGLGIFQNYKKMQKIKEENAAYLAGIGVQPQTQEQADALLSGNVSQLMPGQTGETAQQTTQQTLPTATQTTQQSVVPTQAEQVAASGSDFDTASVGNFAPLKTDGEYLNITAGGAPAVVDPGQGGSPTQQATVPEQAAAEVAKGGAKDAPPPNDDKAAHEAALQKKKQRRLEFHARIDAHAHKLLAQHRAELHASCHAHHR